MTWAIEKFGSVRCGLIWYEKNHRLPSYTVAVFKGAEGEEAAERILAILLQHSPHHRPDKWNASA